MSDVPPLGAIVELREGLEGFYNGAKAGWRGLVKDHKVDDGFSLIYVEWDKDYWRYDDSAKQKDGWTYPSHFSVVGQVSNTPQEFAAEMVAHAAEPEGGVCENCGEAHSEEDERATYLGVLTAAANEAAKGEGFALFFVQRNEDDESLSITPYMVSACITDEAQALVEAQVVKVAETCVHKMMVEYLRKFT